MRTRVITVVLSAIGIGIVVWAIVHMLRMQRREPKFITELCQQIEHDEVVVRDGVLTYPLKTPAVKLQSQDAIERSDAVEELKRASESGIPYLVRALRSKYSDVQMDAAFALGEMRSTVAVPDLIQLSGDSNEYVRAAAILSLGQIGDPKAIVPLAIAFLHDEDDRVRNEAWQAVKAIQPSTPDPVKIVALVGKLSEKTAEGLSASHKLKKIGLPAVPFLLDTLKDQNLTRRVSAIQLLGWIGAQDAVGPLGELSDDPDDLVRLAVGQAIAEITVANEK